MYGKVVMHELYLAEKVIKEVLRISKKNNAKEILEVNIAIPKDEHFTEKVFAKILKDQAYETKVEKAKLKGKIKDTKKVYIKDIKISKK